jgi:hypothetical protein
MKPQIGSHVYDRRTRRVGVFNGVSKCGRFALVKYKGTRPVIVPLVEVRRVYKWQLSRKESVCL